MNVARIKLSALFGTAALALGLLAASPVTASASEAYTCSGTPANPGVLAGTHNSVIVSGVCFVNGGPAVVRGDLTLEPGSALIAAFAMNDATGHGTSSLTVRGDSRVRSGATLILGCIFTSFPCFDDNQNNPTLASADRVSGDLSASGALAVIVHDSTIGGDVRQLDGGEGASKGCAPQGIFAAFGSPVYSDYEDSTIRGDISVKGLSSCWLGLARDHVGGDMTLINDNFADPDAIEILSNNIRGDLTCRGDSMVWDSSDPTGNLWPRAQEPNTVHGERNGQCNRLQDPVNQGDPRGPLPF